MWRFLILFIFLSLIFLTSPVFARTTPADIISEQQQSYNQKLNSYSPATQTKVKNMTQAIDDTNKKQTDQLETIMERQGQILDEVMIRNGKTYRVADGVSRNLTDPIENANYWITYAHEAVAYQAARKYIPNLGAEANWKGSMNNQIAALQSDMSVLKGKILKSQKILEGVINK